MDKQCFNWIRKFIVFFILVTVFGNENVFAHTYSAPTQIGFNQSQRFEINPLEQWWFKASLDKFSSIYAKIYCGGSGKLDVCLYDANRKQLSSNVTDYLAEYTLTGKSSSYCYISITNEEEFVQLVDI